MAIIPFPRRPSAIQSNHHKTAHALNENAAAFVERYGIENTAILHLTFKKRLSPEEAAVCLKKVVRGFCNYFDDWIWTMGLGSNRRPHYHVLVACRTDVRSGTDLSAFRTLGMLEKGYDEFSQWVCKIPVPKEELRLQLRAILSNSANQSLKALRTTLYPRLITAGFGPQSILQPIHSDGESIAGYMHKNYMETVLGRNLDFKGQRLVGYRLGAERRCPSVFGWARCPHWRRAAQRIGEAFEVEYESMSPTFGPKWGHRINYLMAELESRYGDLPRRWPTWAIIQLSANTMPKLPEVPTLCCHDSISNEDHDFAVAA